MANMTDKTTFVGKKCTINARGSHWWDVTVIFMSERGIIFEDIVIKRQWGKKTTHKRTMYIPMSQIVSIKTEEEVE